jgi:hypothetical protein
MTRRKKSIQDRSSSKSILSQWASREEEELLLKRPRDSCRTMRRKTLNKKKMEARKLK